MSGLDSWEDDPAAQDDRDLSRQTQQNLNLQGQGGHDRQGHTFVPAASSFQPGAQSFQPGAQTFQPGQPYQQHGYNQPQYNQYYNQQQSYGGYPQYGQGGYGQGSQGYGQPQASYNKTYGNQYGAYSQPQSSQPHAAQSKPTPVIAKRPVASQTPLNGDSTPTPPTVSAPAPATLPSDQAEAQAPLKAKVLSTKILTIGATTPVKKEPGSAEDGAKVAAVKAIEKTERQHRLSPAESILQRHPQANLVLPRQKREQHNGRQMLLLKNRR